MSCPIIVPLGHYSQFVVLRWTVVMLARVNGERLKPPLTNQAINHLAVTAKITPLVRNLPCSLRSADCCVAVSWCKILNST